MQTAQAQHRHRTFSSANGPPRKNAALKKLARQIECVRRLSEKMPFFGTFPAFKIILNLLGAIRNGIAAASSAPDLGCQVLTADLLTAKAVTMSQWSEGDFRAYYKVHGIEAPESLGVRIVRAKRPAEKRGAGRKLRHAISRPADEAGTVSEEASEVIVPEDPGDAAVRAIVEAARSRLPDPGGYDLEKEFGPQPTPPRD